MKKNICYAGILGCVLFLVTGCSSVSGERKNYREAGIEALNTGNYQEAVTSFNMALEQSEGFVGKFDIDVIKYRAEAEYLLEDYKAAAKSYEILVEADGNHQEYQYLKCMSLAGAGEVEAALSSFETAGLLDTKNTSIGREKAILALGAAMEEAERTDEAMALYQKAQAEGIRNAVLFNRMGLCKMQVEEYEAAIAYFDQGIQTGDTGILRELLFNKAVSYEYQGNFVRALELMEEYLEKYGSDEEVEREIAFLKTR